VPQLDGAGIVISQFRVARDITERKRTEAQLAYQANLLANVNDAVIASDEKFILISWNHASEQIYGWKEEEAIGRLGHELLQTEFLTTSRPAAIKQLTETGEFFADVTQLRKDGTRIVIETHASVLRDKNDELIGYVSINRDITAPKRAEEALRSAQARYRALFDQAPHGVLLIDAETAETIEFNDTACKQLGYTREEFAALRISDYEALESPGETHRHIQKALSEGTDDFETMHRTKSGVLRNIRVWAKAFQLGERIACSCIFQDITDRKQVEEALRRSHDLLDLTGQMAEVGGWELDLETQTLSWTEEVYRIHEVDPATRLNVAEAIDFYTPAARPVITAAVQAATDSGTPWDLELPLITATGRQIWVRTQGEAESRDGRIVRLYGALQDITKRKQADESRQLQSAALNAAATASVITDRAGVIEWVNPAFTRLTGYAAAEAIGKNPRELLKSDKQDQAFYQNLWGTILAGKVWRGEMINRRKDGSLYAEDQTITPVQDGSGAIAHFVAIKEDITDRKRAEERIEAQLQRLAALRAIDTIITSGLGLRLTLNAVLEQTTAQLGIDAASVLLLNPPTLTLEYATGRGFRTEALQHTRLRLGEGYAGQAALERHLIHIPNLRERKTDFVRSPHFSAEGFVAYYAVPLIAKGQVMGVLEVFHRAPHEANEEWLAFLETLAGRAAIAVDNSQLFENLQRSNVDLSLAYDATIEGWSRALDLRDKDTEGHTQRVTKLTERLARAMGTSEAELVHIRRGALLHDIGKMGVPEAILLKPDKLTDEEWVIMRRHPQLAFEMLAPITFLRPALDIPGWHHEKWDGTGYPRGLKGEQIPLAARIFAIVDVWDALRSDRPYRPAWPEAKVLWHIRRLAGTQFDPKVVERFMQMLNEA
jgi:PAS domain S-box-containing protein/putative nucleotidyltransferase with HDIG domain